MFENVYKTLRLKAINLLTDSSNIFISIISYKPKRLVSNLRLPKEQKQAKTAISRKKLSERSVEGNKK